MIRVLLLLVRMLTTFNAISRGTYGRLILRRGAYRGAGRVIRRIFR